LLASSIVALGICLFPCLDLLLEWLGVAPHCLPLIPSNPPSPSAASAHLDLLLNPMWPGLRKPPPTPIHLDLLLNPMVGRWGPPEGGAWLNTKAPTTRGAPLECINEWGVGRGEVGLRDFRERLRA